MLMLMLMRGLIFACRGLHTGVRDERLHAIGPTAVAHTLSTPGPYTTYCGHKNPKHGICNLRLSLPLRRVRAPGGMATDYPTQKAAVTFPEE